MLFPPQVREPTAVFTLLETLYHSFDKIAKRRRVFKVETVGDVSLFYPQPLSPGLLHSLFD